MTRQRTTEEWLRICAEIDIPATRIYSLDDLPAHPHLAAVKLFQETVHSSEGPIRYVAPTTQFSATPAEVRFGAPLLGQHTDEILREAGFTDSEVASLAARRIVVRK
jgi:formyl-CoA transferase